MTLFPAELEEPKIDISSKGLSQLPYTKQKMQKPLPHNPPCLTTVGRKPFENIARKGQSAGNQHFLLTYHVFYSSQNKIQFLSYADVF